MSPRRLLLGPLAALYGFGVETRLALYRRGLFPVRRAGRPVISVGNVAAGGTGKTPFVRWLTHELFLRGQRPAILTRGYSRTSRGLVLVSDGTRPCVDVSASGDEAAVLARALRGIPIVAEARRSRAAAWVEASFLEVTCHVLDDGFSHVGLARDLDIVLLSAANPGAGGALLPLGGLREKLSSLARADLLVVTHSEEADPAATHEIASRYAKGTPIYHARTEVVEIVDRHGGHVEPRDLPPETFVAVSGLASPSSFRRTLARLRLTPTRTLEFRDHASYGDDLLGRRRLISIQRAAEESGATAIVTTEKDAVKLLGRTSLPIFTVVIRTPVVEPGFISDVLARIPRRPV